LANTICTDSMYVSKSDDVKNLEGLVCLINCIEIDDVSSTLVHECMPSMYTI
jgi:hypothetical protein